MDMTIFYIFVPRRAERRAIACATCSARVADPRTGPIGLHGTPPGPEHHPGPGRSPPNGAADPIGPCYVLVVGHVATVSRAVSPGVARHVSTNV